MGWLNLLEDSDLTGLAVPEAGSARPVSPARDRRARGRTPFGLPLRVRAEGGFGCTGWLRDLSPSGAFVELVRVADEGPAGPSRLVLGARVALGFVVPERQVALARGRVVRVDRQGFAMSITELTGAFAGLVSWP